MTMAERLRKMGDDGARTPAIPWALNAIGGSGEGLSSSPTPGGWGWGRGSDYVAAVAVVTACVSISFALKPILPLANLSLVFLIGVLIVAVRTATVPAVLTALVSATAYNFFFTEPFYSFHMHHTADLLTVGFYLFVGLLAGQMAGRLREQMHELRALNEQNHTLADLNRQLASAPDLPTMASAAASVLSDRFRVPVRVLLPNESTVLEPMASAEDDGGLDQSTRSAAQWALDHRVPSGQFTGIHASVSWRFLPLHGADESFGVIAVGFPPYPPPSGEVLSALDVLVDQVSLAMTRARLGADLERARVAEETERLRSALLSSVSHDLRTPLASMIGSATTLRDLHGDLSADDCVDLLDAIVSEGERLNRYIQNLLDMTWLGHGGLEITRGWIGLDDILNMALRRTRSLLGGIRVVRSVDPELPLLYVHSALIEQALVNVIENAARFSPQNGEIQISAGQEGGEVHIVITDQGPGIPAEQRKKVFEMHFTGADGDGDKHGGGLGLAICAGMIGAHMGSVEAQAGPDGTGASIHIHLPITNLTAVDGDDG